MKVDYREGSVTERLREVERLRRQVHRTRPRVDMSESAVSQRLREVERLRRLCLALGGG